LAKGNRKILFAILGILVFGAAKIPVCRAQCSNLDFTATSNNPISNTKGCALFVVKFTAKGTSTAAGSIFRWNLGGGYVNGVDTITKPFTTPGKYTISMHVKFSNGDTCTVTKDTFITVLPPLVPKMYVSSGAEVCDRATTYTVFIDSTIANIISREWIIEGTKYSTAPNKQMVYRFNHEAPQVVTMQVTDKNGCTSVAKSSFPVYDSIPLDMCATFDVDGKTTLGHFSVWTGPLGSRAIKSYKWTFPGGTPFTNDSAQPHIRYAYSRTARHDVYCTITMKDGCTYTIIRRAFVDRFIDDGFKKFCVSQELATLFTATTDDAGRLAWGVNFPGATAVIPEPLGTLNPHMWMVHYTTMGSKNAVLSYDYKGSGCRITVNLNGYVVFAGPLPGMQSGDNRMCNPFDTVHLYNISDTSGAPDAIFTWYILDSTGAVLKKRGKLGPTAKEDTFYVPGKEGILSVRLIGTSKITGCADTLTNNAYISVATPGIKIVSPPSVQCFEAVHIESTASPPDRTNSYLYSWRLTNVSDTTDVSAPKGSKPDLSKLLLGVYNAIAQVNEGKCSADTTKDSLLTVIGDKMAFAPKVAVGCLDPVFVTTLSPIFEKFYPKTPPIYNWHVDNATRPYVKFLTPGERTTEAIFTRSQCYDIYLDIITILDKDTCKQTIVSPGAVCVGTGSYFETQPLQCPGDTIAVTNYTDDDVNSYRWHIDPSDQATILPNDTSRVISIVFKKDTCYTISLIASKIINGYNCTDTTIKTECMAAPEPIFYTTTPKLYCAPVAARFIPSSKNATLYLWNFGDGDSLLTSSDSEVSHIYFNLSKGAYTVSLTAMNDAGCRVTKSLTNAIDVSGPVPRFKVNGQIGCDSLTVTFQNTSKNVYKYVFFDDDGSPPINSGSLGKHTYAIQDPNLDSVMYYPTLQSLDDSTCNVYFQDTIVVYHTPKNAKLREDQNLGCVPLTVNFQGSSTYAKTWHWDFDNDGKVDNVINQNPAFTYTKPGTYIPQLDASVDGHCAVKISGSPIVVTPNAKAGILPMPGHVCGRQLVHFKNTSVNFKTFFIDYGDGSPVDSNVLVDHSYFYDPARDHGDSVRFFPKIIVFNNANCSDTFKTVVTAYRMPIAGFSPAAVSGCSPMSDTFKDTSRYGFATEWDYDNDGQIDGYGQIATHVFSPGIYTVKMRSISLEGCVDSVVKVNLVTVNDPPKVDFKVSDSDVCYRTAVVFNNLTQPVANVVKWTWNFHEPADSSDTSNIKNPVYPFLTKGYHTISLQAIDNKGCAGSLQKKVVYVEDTLPPPNSNLLYVTVKDTHTVEIAWAKNRMNKFARYRLNRLTGSSFVTIDSPNNVDDTVATIYDPQINTSLSKYCYTLQGENACGKVSFGSYSHCTILLKGYALSGPRDSLSWSYYYGWAPRAYRIYRAVSAGPLVLLDSVKGDVLSYTDTALCDENYCYYVQAVQDSGTYTSASNTVCMKALYVHNTTPVTVRYATVIGNRDLQLAWDTLPKKDFSLYSIDKYSKASGWVKGYYQTKSNSLVDKQVDVNNSSYAYVVNSIDKCGYPGPSGNLGTSIWLTAKIQKDNVALGWNAYHNWAAGVKNYTLQVQTKDHSFKTIARLNDTSYTDDSVYRTIDTAYCYRVVAYENGSGNDSSVSNLSCAILPSRIFIPNAFTPGNGDSLNDVWIVSAISIYNAVGGPLKNFHCRVFNRWGTLVFESDDLNKGWDGKFKNGYAPMDVYIYMLDAEGIDGRAVHLKGNLTIVK